MKKRLVFLMLFVTVFAFSGCSFFIDATTTTRTPILTSAITTTAASSSSTLIDTGLMISEIKAMIYEEMYAQIRAEVIQDLSEEEFNLIYDQVLADIYTKIDAGDLSVQAKSIAETVLSVVSTEAPAVIGVSNYNASLSLSSIGSGVIYKHVGDTYYVVTNHHVVEDGAFFRIHFTSGPEINATLIGFDETADLAVLTFVSNNQYKVASFGNSTTLLTGSVVLAVGHPNGYDYFGSVTMGIVSGTRRYFDVDNDNVKDMFVGYVQHDASINSGNSGGALFNLSGEVIGINVIKIASTEIEGMGFAIPSSLVAAICSDIEEFGYSKQVPGVGIRFNDIASDRDKLISDGIIIPEEITVGFYVHQVTVGSSADGYVLAGDIILEIGDIVITNLYNFSGEFSKYHVGDIIDIVVYRNGSTIILSDIELKSKVG